MSESVNEIREYNELLIEKKERKKNNKNLILKTCQVIGIHLLRTTVKC